MKVYEVKSSLLLTVIMPLCMILLLIIVGHISPSFTSKYINDETGALEISHIVIPFFAILFSLYTFFQQYGSLQYHEKFILILFGLGSFYILGEEASWGQHAFGWSSGEFFLEHNRQNETNLHNISSFFNQKPRAILQFAIIISSIIFPILYVFGKKDIYNKHVLFNFFPPKSFFFVAMAGLIIQLFPGILNQMRASEVQEFCYYWLIFMYVICFSESVKREDQSKHH